MFGDGRLRGRHRAGQALLDLDNLHLALSRPGPDPPWPRPAQAPLDLDNLHLADLGGAPALEARFELEALLLTGSCLDIGAARGDQACGRTLPYSCRGRRGAARWRFCAAGP